MNVHLNKREEQYKILYPTQNQGRVFWANRANVYFRRGGALSYFQRCAEAAPLATKISDHHSVKSDYRIPPLRNRVKYLEPMVPMQLADFVYFSSLLLPPATPVFIMKPFLRSNIFCQRIQLCQSNFVDYVGCVGYKNWMSRYLSQRCQRSKTCIQQNMYPAKHVSKYPTYWANTANAEKTIKINTFRLFMGGFYSLAFEGGTKISRFLFWRFGTLDFFIFSRILFFANRAKHCQNRENVCLCLDVWTILIHFLS